VKEVVGVQYLRGLAALMVVVFHLVPPLAAAWGIGRFPVAVLAGGVDVFFVISGFIIWRSTANPAVRPWPWWRSRLVRIVPMYWIALVATLVSFAAHGWALPGPAEALKAFLFIPSRNSATGEFTPFFVPGWTLHYEFFFYAVMGALLFVPRRALRVVLICAFFGTLVALRRAVDTSSAVQFRLTSPLMFEFVGGILVALFHDRVDLGRRAGAVGGLCIAASLAFLILVSPRLYPDGPRTVYFGGPALLLVFGTVCLEEPLRRHVLQPLKTLGDASYSLYLSHTLTMFLPEWLLDRAGVAALVPRFLFSLTLCVLFGVVVYRRVERPLLGWMRHRPAKSDSARAAT
jgi:exopolysaccharide production protein ExoZ